MYTSFFFLFLSLSGFFIFSSSLFFDDERTVLAFLGLVFFWSWSLHLSCGMAFGGRSYSDRYNSITFYLSPPPSPFPPNPTNPLFVEFFILIIFYYLHLTPKTFTLLCLQWKEKHNTTFTERTWISKITREVKKGGGGAERKRGGWWSWWW